MKRLFNFFCVTVIFMLLIECFKSNNVYGNEVNNTKNNTKNENMTQCRKEAFLTFDDGPSANNTPKILKILKENNIRATFFVVGIKAEENPSVLKQLSDEGMAICVHTYSHKYKKIYKNPQAYINDYEACRDLIKKILNKDPLPFVRMPGGSTNHAASKEDLILIKNSLRTLGVKYVDWNVCSGDADSHEVPVYKIKKNVKTQCEGKKIAVILMHDTVYKHFTVESLPDVIKNLKEQGFEFKTLADLSKAEEKELIDLGIINK